MVKVSAHPTGPKQTNFSLADAKTFAEKLLAIDSKDIKLSIESIDERKNHNGQDVISIHICMNTVMVELRQTWS